MKIHSVNPVFAVADVGARFAGMKGNWDLPAILFHPMSRMSSASCAAMIIEIMLQRVADYQKPDLYDLRNGGGVWDAYLRITGLQELYDRVKDRLELKKPLRRQPYGLSEFEVKDLNGYVLVFSELID